MNLYFFCDQLGHGTEKDAYLPKPCRVGRVAGSQCVALDVSLGLCHTVVLVQNLAFDFSEFVPSPRKMEPIAPPATIFKSPVREEIVMEEIVIPRSPTPPLPLEIEFPVQPPVREEAVMVVEMKSPVPKTPEAFSPLPVRTPVTVGIMDILKQREDRQR